MVSRRALVSLLDKPDESAILQLALVNTASTRLRNAPASATNTTTYLSTVCQLTLATTNDDVSRRGTLSASTIAPIGFMQFNRMTQEFTSGALRSAHLPPVGFPYYDTVNLTLQFLQSCLRNHVLVPVIGRYSFITLITNKQISNTMNNKLFKHYEITT